MKSKKVTKLNRRVMMLNDSFAITIPKQIVQILNLKKGDEMLLELLEDNEHIIMRRKEL